MPFGNIIAGTAATAPPAKRPTLRARLISAAVLAPLALVAVLFGTPYWDILIAIMGGLMAWEWGRICGRRPGWLVLGAFYIALPCLALLWIRDQPDGLATLLWILALVWATDSGAYAAGRTLGGPRLASRISPNKTWSGLLGGMAGAALVGLGVAAALGGTRAGTEPWRIVALSAALAVVEQAGDLFESAVKRHFGVKDSSNLIPGHGGVLDRVDGLLAVSLAVAGLSLWAGRSILFPP